MMMEADWDEVQRIAVPPPGPHVLPTIATTIAFDDIQELLWAGNEYGRITSFYGPELTRYTSVRAHPVSEGSVRQFLFHEKGVISLSSRSVHMITRRGLTQWHITHTDMTDLRCMSFTAQTNRVIVAGCQKSMFNIDIDKGVIIDTIPTEHNYTIMKKSRYLCCATDTGSVNALSLADFKLVKTWKAHGAAINDMDARNDFLVTCGFSVRHLGAPIVDPLANVYDLKTLAPLPPIPFHAGAAYVRMHPRLHTTSFVASQSGQLQVVDLMNPNTINLRQANVNFMLGLEISPSGEALAINDAECAIHLWGSPSKIHFNEMSKETEFADMLSPRSQLVDWSAENPLSMIGMPYYNERLLSAWPSHLVFDYGSQPAPVDPAIIPYLRPAELGHYAANPKKGRRYQIENTRQVVSAEPALVAPKFLSEKARESPRSKTDGNVGDVSSALASAKIGAEVEEDPLLKYSNVEIKYSKFGVDDFDFRFYNKTIFSGLETHIANSFTNSLLQLYKFIPLVRNLALHHAASSCLFEDCLLCEMGYLFDMLDKANGQNCQATNLLKAFSNSREASKLGLLEENLTNKALSGAIQSVNRFILNQISNDYRAVAPESEELDRNLATIASESVRCMFCRNETVRPGNAFANELIYPVPDAKQVRRTPPIKFSTILKSSIERETQNRGWCNHCRRYQQVAIRKTVHRMPPVMMLNTGHTTPYFRQIWNSPGWLPEELGIIVDNGQLHCFEGDALRSRIQNRTPGLVIYELVGLVAEINITEHQKPHLVSFINVNISSLQPEENNNWHLFNDFLVTEVSREEALKFTDQWKVPSVLAYQVKGARHKLDSSWKNNLDTTLLFHEWAMNGNRIAESCHILSPEERPQPGTSVALDTEFVDLEKAEIDVKADGSQEIIRPSRSGLARVSVLRGSGLHEGVPFIDDYITIKESIVDYVTQYSGIKPGDLDPRTSQHNLVPLKVAYKKLWLLLNLGCIFVGHGLASDFRKINIQVPKSQTVDTQYLFFHPGKNRRLSLRYLAWAVFKEYIQEETTESITEGHDSIEDARMALRLWKKFQEYEDAGIVTQMLEEIFSQGFKLGFRPPPRNGTSTPASSSGNGSANASIALAATALTRPGTATTYSNAAAMNGSGRNTPDLATGSGTGTAGNSAPTTPRQTFRRSNALTPSNGSFGGASGQADFFGGSPLR